jgi:16S rRNA (guanine966-N2)-methyltransferase
MRIISGSAGGLPIKVPPAVTRPTTDRTRQAIFSMLGGTVIGARVLDLYAGSGALGLEALSRGAESCLFVEQDSRACGVLRENIAKTKLPGAEVRAGEAMQTLRALAAAGRQFDLVLADPPYAHEARDVDHGARLIASDDLRRVLAPGAGFLLECRVTKNGNDSWSGWEIERDREYGSTRVLWMRLGHVAHAESDHL